MKNLEKLIQSKFIPVLCLLGYAIITICRIMHHIPFGDEAHAWSLAENLNYLDMFNEVKNEGHFFIWQTILYPFAKLHLYPYSMQFINWIFCTIALILMWYKAPFNNITKALITFSFPFLGCYGVVARCYSIGIMLLFCLTILYRDKLKHPIVYSILLVICANTSVMALMGASAFGFLFLYDLFKHTKLTKKEYIVVLGILSVGVILVLSQLFNMAYFGAITSNRRLHVSIKLFRNVFRYNSLLLNFSLLGIFSVPILKFVFNRKDVLFFISWTYVLLLLFVTTVYGGYFWHLYFFYIYLIISMWLVCQNAEKSLSQVFAIVVLSVISLILVFHKPTSSEYYFVYGLTDSKDFLGYVMSDENLRTAQIIQNDGILMEVRPYFMKHNMVIRTHCENKIVTDVSLMNGNHKFCAVKRTLLEAQRHPDVIKNIVKNTELQTYTYLYSTDYILNNDEYVVKAKGYSIYFKKYRCYDKYCFWKIEVNDDKN